MCGSYLRRLTLLSIIGNILQVNKVCSNDGIVDRVIITELQLDALTQWREHLCKNQLFIPYRSITVFLHTCLALEELKLFSLGCFPTYHSQIPAVITNLLLGRRNKRLNTANTKILHRT
jgi:hypothetical protein